MSKNYKVVHLKDLDADKYLLMQEFLIGDKDGEQFATNADGYPSAQFFDRSKAEEYATISNEPDKYMTQEELKFGCSILEERGMDTKELTKIVNDINKRNFRLTYCAERFTIWFKGLYNNNKENL